jgi:hypothetical protein
MNPLAVLSVVFAFVFAPVGAALGHLALGQIRHGLQRGRDLALVGLTLSYTFIVLTVVGLTVWLVTAGTSHDVVVAHRPDDVVVVPDRTPTASAPDTDLVGALLSLDELKTILKAPGLAETKSSSGESAAGDAQANLPECAGAVAAGLNTEYDHSGAGGYVRSGYSDPRTATLVDQVAASFRTAADAEDFVAHSVEQWRRCEGKEFTLTSSNSPGLTWHLGTVTVAGDRATLQNTVTARQPVPQYRIMASKGSVVIDLSVIARDLSSDQPATIADHILARVKG